ncbi:MAG: PD-(D/E)XK nuclease family protein [Clostridia bacterium]
MLTITNSSEYNLNNKKNLIIVPETFSHNYERFLCEKYSNEVSKTTEVLTFSRISDRIFAEIGGFANNYINEPGRILAMYNAINSVFVMLTIYNSNKIEIITKILSTIDEFKMYKISENDLLNASKELEGTLKSKVLDLYYIYSAYNKFTSNDIQDPRQELEFLCENFCKCTIYDDYNVYFDKFDGFTPQQYAFLTEMLKKNINVTISLDIKDNTDKLYDLSATARTTFEQLQKLCKRYNFDIKVKFSSKNERKFEQISQNIFEFENISIKNDDIKLHVSTTIQNECLHTAGKIIDIVSKLQGVRYSDICVTARNFDEYNEQLRVAFERFNIPVFISKKEDITKIPPVKLIISALNIILSKYKAQNVFEYLKSPMLHISANKVCSLEDYCLRWNIKYLNKNSDFVANPSFNLKKNNENDQKRLDSLNEFKKTVLEPIVALEENFKKSEVGADFIKALYDFCEKIKLGSSILYFETEDIALKQQYDQLWNIIIDSFDQFFEISGKQRMDVDDFVKLYQTLITSYEIAEIPSSIDNITAGGFERVVGENCKILFILGADADNLPCKVTENTILNDDEREQLENLEIEMAPFGNDLVIREFELIANVFNIAQEKLYISFCEVSTNKNTASSIFKRIVDIVDDVKVTTDSSVDFDFMYKSKKTALEQFAVYKNTEKIKDINPEILTQANKNILKKETVDKIYSKKISPSRIDIQTSCQFRYFMQYGLKVKTRKKVTFNQAENGNFIHFILEQILNKSDYVNTDVSKSIDKYIEIYIKEYFSENLVSDPKFAYILMNLKKNTYKIVDDIVKEIKASDFKPQEFELEIGDKSNVKPLQIGEFSVIGKVDRVDICKDGDKNYLRIIDYKSGVKTLDLSTFYHGINMQMFIYMLALEKNSEQFDNASAAGALYVPTKIPKISLKMPETEDKIHSLMEKKLQRSGMILEDKSIIDKMEKNSPFIYLPVKYNSGKNQPISKSSKVASLARFDAMKNFVTEKLGEITKDFESGKTAPNPYAYGDQSSCDFCEFSSSCGFCASYDMKKVIEKLDADEFWEKLGV